MRDNWYIKDPIHKEIILKNDSSDLFLELTKTREFLRLRSIMQLGLSYKLFPSANHTRYSHSLGAYQVASKFTEVLSEKISKKDAELVKVAALLHDLGHGPLSHVFEKLTPLKTKHEEWTTKIISCKDSEVNKVLRKYKVDVNQVIQIIEGTHKNKWMIQLISSDIDVDRIDYLLRDSYFVGTHFGTIDLDILLKRVKIIDNILAFSENTSTLIRSFWYGRIHMNIDVYENKNLLIYEWILELIFTRLREIQPKLKEYENKILFYKDYEWMLIEKEISVDEYLALNDYTLFCFLNSIRKIKIDDLLDYLAEAFEFGKGFDYMSFEEFNIKYGNKTFENDKYTFRIKPISQKTLYSKKEESNIYQYGNNDKLIKFKDSSLYKSIKNNTESKKIVLINQILLFNNKSKGK